MNLNMKILISILALTVLSLVGCGSDKKDDSDAVGVEDVSKATPAQLNSLCLEGAYRSGEYCDDLRNSTELQKICRVMSSGSGDCDGLSSEDLEKTCEAGLYGTDTCDDIANSGLRNACKAAAYGSDDFCVTQ